MTTVPSRLRTLAFAFLAGALLLAVPPALAQRISLGQIQGDLKSLKGIVCGVDDLENCPNPITNPSSNGSVALPSFEVFLNGQKQAWDELKGGAVVIGAGGVSVDPIVLSHDVSQAGPPGREEFLLELQGVSSDSVRKIEISDLVVPAIPTTTSDPATFLFKQFKPGQPERVRLVLTMGSPSGVVSGAFSWWVEAAEMTPGAARNSILFVNQLGGGNQTLLEYEFVNCLPVSWASSSNVEGGGGPRGPRVRAEEILVIECTLHKYRNTVRPALQDWMSNVLSGDTSTNNRTLLINHLDPDAKVIRALDYGNSFLTRYSFPSLDTSSDLPVSETISIKASQLKVAVPMPPPEP